MIVSPRVALARLVDELRDELAAETRPELREEVADELCAALDRLHALIVHGAVPALQESVSA